MPDLIEGSVTEILQNAGAPVNGTDEVQTLTYGGVDAVAVAGNYVINFMGHRVTVAFDEAAADLQTHLRSLGSIGALGCSVIVAAGPPRVYTVTFDGANMGKRALDLMTIESNTMIAAGGTAVTVTVAESVAGVDATCRNAPLGALLIDTTNRALYQNQSATLQAPTWVAWSVNATTASAAELNNLDGPVAGTAMASKAAVLGANTNLDTLAIADGGLRLGAGAGTAITATAAELNKKVAAAGHLANGLGVMGLARFTYDPTTTAGLRTIGAHGTGVTLPDNAIVIGGFVEVMEHFHSEGADAGTIAISVEGANDIITAAAVSGAPYSSTGLKAIIPKSNTPESTGVKTTAAREITCTVAGQNLLSGKLVGFLHYVVSD